MLQRKFPTVGISATVFVVSASAAVKRSDTHWNILLHAGNPTEQCMSAMHCTVLSLTAVVHTWVTVFDSQLTHIKLVEIIWCVFLSINMRIFLWVPWFSFLLKYYQVYVEWTSWKSPLHTSLIESGGCNISAACIGSFKVEIQENCITVCITLFGINNNDCPLLIVPDSSFPKIIVPISWRNKIH